MKFGLKNVNMHRFGGKRLNQVAKFGGKALLAGAAIAPLAAMLNPALGAALEAGGLAGSALTGIHKVKQHFKDSLNSPRPMIREIPEARPIGRR